MKKILYIAEAFDGGVLSFLQELTNNLVDQYEITILYGRRQTSLEQRQTTFDPRIQLIEIKSFQRALNLNADYQTYQELKKYLRQIDPDVIHLNSSKAGYLGRLLPYRKDQKVFYNPHGYSFLMQGNTHHQEKIYYLAEKTLGYRTKVQTVAVGQGEYLQSKKVTNNSILVNNGIDLQAIDQIAVNTEISEKAVVTVGRIDVQKNPRLFNQLAQLYPEKEFVWLGDGPLKDQLTAPNVRISDWLAHEQIIAILKKVQTFVLLSKWEGLPLALLEAMYCGNYCIVTNVIGNKELIRDNETGAVINDLTQLLEAFKCPRAKRQRLMTNAQREVEKDYNLHKMVQRYCQIYG
ncbi:glycosyltransferase [Bombilactobacillus folatiphilus]|uniref:Glycosyltransferase n=1 Tax=Bombilactobacillus folatiphilus TaxID=2923362 RepID=A0ABY4P7Z2_9LACO|nr:glycosyltransferase [Bombilactobacillus folatiphilus]UQS81716.1 glycosyltransferase [Bombilactobacillus folatiphilus]